MSRNLSGLRLSLSGRGEGIPIEILTGSVAALPSDLAALIAAWTVDA